MATNVNGEAFDAGYQAKYDQRTTEFSNGTKALENLRMQRNAKLAETDWWAVSDRTMSSDETNYRQALRDLPSNYTTSDSSALQNNLSNLVWPTKP